MISKDMLDSAELISHKGGVWHGDFFCYCPESEEIQDNHETQFVKKFIVPEKRQRWLDYLKTKRKRNKFLVRLSDESDFITKNMSRLPQSINNAQNIYRYLIKSGASDKCWVISQFELIECREMSIEDALDKCVGIGLGTVLSIIPGKLCYYEAEMPGERWLLSVGK
jgi:hypothetical protein